MVFQSNSFSVPAKRRPDDKGMVFAGKSKLPTSSEHLSLARPSQPSSVSSQSKETGALKRYPASESIIQQLARAPRPSQDQSPLTQTLPSDTVPSASSENAIGSVAQTENFTSHGRTHRKIALGILGLSISLVYFLFLAPVSYQHSPLKKYLGWIDSLPQLSFALPQGTADQTLAQVDSQPGQVKGAATTIGQVKGLTTLFPNSQRLVISIPVVFKQAVEAGTLVVDNALTINGSATVGKDLTVGGNNTTTGNQTIGGTLTTTGAATFKNTVDIAGQVTLHSDVSGPGIKVDLGSGTIIASNIVYSVTAGDGISMGGSGQNPQVINSDRGTAQFIFKNISDGTNTIVASQNDDTLKLLAGTGIVIATDTTNKSMTFTVDGAAINVSGFTDDGSNVRLTDITDSVGIGTNTPIGKFQVVGNSTFTGDLHVTGGLTVDNGTVIANGINNLGGGITNAGSITGATGITSSGTITFSGLSTGIVHSSFAGVLSSSAVGLNSADVSGVLPTTKGGTGLSGFARGDLIYGSGTNTLTTLGGGSDNQILTMAGGVPVWANASGVGGFCPDCLVGDPATSQNLIPTAPGATGLSVHQANGGTVDIFNVTNYAGTTKYFNIDSNGNVILGGAGSVASNGTFTVSPSNTDPITISPHSQGLAAHTGTITSADLTLDRTWTFPDESGAICLTSGNCNGVGGNFGGFGTVGYLPKFDTTTNVTNSQIFDDGTNVGINDNTPSYKLDVNGTFRTTGAGTFDSTLHATGATTLANTLQVTGAGSFLSTLDVTAATTLSSTLQVTGGTTLNGTLGVVGNATFDTNSLYVDAVNHLVGVGTIAPAALFSVGSGSPFQVNGSGAVTAVGVNSGAGLLQGTGGLTVTGAVAINTTGTANTSIGNSTGTFALASNGLNVTTGGALTGVASLDTISTSATALGFAGAGSVAAGGTSNLALDAGSSGSVNIAGVSTGDVNIAGGSGGTGCTIANSTGNLTCTGNITGAATGTVGYWQRVGTTLSPATAGDAVTTSGNISTTATGTITSAGLLTGSAGIAISGGTANINVSGTSSTAIGNTTGTFALISNGGLNVSTAGALTGVSSIDTIAYSATGIGFAGTGSLTSGATTALNIIPGTTGALNLATTNTGNVAIGNSTGTFVLTSNGGLNVSTTGALTGVSSIDTIAHSATAIGFLGTGSLTSGAATALNIIPGTTGALNLATTNTGNVAIGNSTGTFALTSNGGLNVSTTGALTGVSSIDTIAHSATAIGFAGAGSLTAGGTSNLALDAGSSGAVNIAGNSTGNVNIAGGSGSTGCTINNTTGDLTCTGNITGATTGTSGYWARSGITLSSATANDIVTVNQAATGITTANLKSIAYTGTGTFDTTAGALTNYGGYFSNTSTRSAGANNLTNVGLYANATGAQNNYAAIFENGLVGIGTTQPVNTLTVDGAGTTDGAMKSMVTIRNTGAYSTSPVAGLNFNTQYNSAGAYAGLGGITVGKLNATDGDYSSYLALYTRNNGSPTAERLRIDNVGNVGIGLTAPVNPLQVNTAISAAPLTSGTGTNGLLRLGATDTSVALDMGVLGSPAYAWIQPRATTTYATNYNLALNPNGGNVGVGTTNPSALFSVGSSSQFQVSSAGAVTAVGVNSGSGLLQGTGGLTLTGTTAINTTGTANTSIGNSTGTFALTSNGGLNVSTTGALTGVSSLDTIATSATALGFAGVGSLTSGAATNLSIIPGTTGTLNLATTNTGNVAIGNSTGTFALTSSGGLNVSTTGALTGVSSIDTIAHSATAIGFLGTGSLTSGAATALNITPGTTGALNLGTTNTGNIVIGNSTGTFSLTSSGGLNVGTTGALTGVSSIDTIAHSATAITFAGTGSVAAGGTSNLALDAGSSGVVNIAGVSTGDVNIAGGSAGTGCTIVNASGNLTCTGNITGAATGTVGYFTRSGTTLSPATAGDNITTSGNLSTTGSGTITSAGLLTGSAGLTVSGGTANINTSGTSNTAIGNSTGTFSLTSNGGLNVSTTGALTGVSSLDTISTSATALGFAGVGNITSGAGTALNITSGTTGAVTVDSGSSGNVNLGTGSTGKTINIGNATGATAVNVNTGTGSQTFTSLNATGNTSTTSSFNFIDNSLTSGVAQYISSTSTALTTGGLGVYDWSPASTTTATGDLLSLNIGANGTIGNIFNIKNAGSSVFAVSQSQITAGLPTQFTSPGDVSMAYDLQFTNQTASTIQSKAPLYIVAGESFENNDLTLRTFGTGSLVLDTPGGIVLDQAQTMTLANSTTALNVQSGLLNLDTTNSRVGIGTTSPTYTLDIASNTTNTLRVKNTVNTSAMTASFFNDSNTGISALVYGSTYSAGSVFSVGANGSALVSSSAGPLAIGTYSVAQPLILGTNSAERLRIDSSGNVGIGDTSPASLLTVGSGDLFQINSSGNIASIGGAAHTISNSSGALLIDAATSGALNLNGVGTGDVNIAGGSGATGCTVTNSTGALTCTGAITGATTGTVGYWSRAGTTLSPATAGDAVTTSGNISTTSTGTITSAGLLTGSLGLTITGGTAAINSSGTASTTIGNSTGTFALTSSGGLNVSTTGALTGVSSLDTIATSATALGFAGTGSLTSGAATALSITPGTTGALNLATTNTGNVAIGNSTGTFSLTSSGGLNVSTTGALTGVSSIDTIAHSATGIGFAGTGALTTGAATALSITPGTTGALNLGTTNTGNVAIGNSTGTFALTSSGGLNVSTTGALTGVSSIDTVAHSATAIGFLGTGSLTTGAATALSITPGTTGALNLGTTNTGNIVIGNATGTFSLTSSGGLNVGTTGALTGVSSIDTIAHSATAIGFAGTGSVAAGGTSNLALDAGSSGTVNIAGVSTGDVNIAGGSGGTGCTITNSSGALTCTGNITGAAAGTVGYWTRTGTSLAPATAGDAVTTSGNISTTGSGTITSAGLLTGSAGLTVSGGTAAINSSGTASTTIGNSTGTFALTSSGGLNVTTAGALTGVSSLDTISTSATALGFAGAGNITSGAGTALNITSGTTGAVTVDSGSSGNVNLGTGSTGKTINIGNATGATAVNVNTGTGSQTFTSLNATGNTSTTSSFNFIDNSLTSGVAQYISSTSTALTTGGLGVYDWSPASTTTATGDLLSLNIGANGTIGNIFNIKNAGSSVFAVSQSQITASLPAQFTSPGDVSMSYDLNFTNQTASTINSNAPLYIVAGELSESNDLTLKTYNQGSVVIDSAQTTGNILDITNNTLTSGNGLNLSASALTTGRLFNLDPNYAGAGVTGYGQYIDGTDSTANANTDYQLYSNLALTGNAAKTGIGIFSNVSSSSTTADTVIAADLATVNTGVYSTGTKNIYGLRTQPTSTAAATGGTQNIYGFYSNPSTTSGAGATVNAYGGYISSTATIGSGTLNQYGLYIDNGTSGTSGTSTKYGLYVNTQSGADTNYAAVFAGGNVGIGNVTPTNKLTVETNSATGTEAGGDYIQGRFQNTNTGGYAGIAINRAANNRAAGTYYQTAGVSDWFTGTAYNAGGANSAYSIGTDVNFSNAKLTVLTTGNVGIGDSSPASLLSVGASDAFQVNSSGNIVNIGGAAHNISNSAGALLVDAATSGALNLNGVGTGDVNIAGGSGATGCTVTNATGALTCTGNITGAATGTAGYFSRAGTTLQPATAGDNITTSGNLSTTGSGTITSAGLLTGSLGLTISGGTAAINSSGTSSTTIGNSTGTFALTSSGGLNVSTTGALTGVSSLDTIATSATALGFAGTGSLTSGAATALSIIPGTTGALNLATTNTGNVVIGNSTGTFSLTSSGGLNVGTTGALTGVSSIDTIAHSATGIGFAGTGSLTTGAATILNITPGTTGALNLATTNTGNVAIGNSTGTFALTSSGGLNVSTTGALTGVSSIDTIAHSATGIGFAGTGSLTTGAATILNITPGTTGALNLATTNTGNVAIGNATGTFALTSSGGLNVTTTGALTGVSSIDTIAHSATGIGFAGTGSLTTGAATALSITPGTTGALNLGTTNTGNVAIGNSTGTFALTSSGGLNVSTTGALTGVSSLDTISTSATALGFAGAGTISSGAGTALNITSGTTGAVTVDSGSSGNVNLGTGSTGKVINIGNVTGATAVNINSGTGAQSFNSTVATTTGTAGAFSFNANSLTSGTGAYFNSSSLTTGHLVDINTGAANTITTGTLLNVASTATSLTSGNLGVFDWSPTSAATATGDLVSINIGANGLTSGNLFNIKNNGASVFAVNQNQITASVPVQFNAPGDIAAAYDLNFTNQTASYINSNAPLYIVAGESFESNDLTLRTFNSGDLVLDAAGGVVLNQAQPWNLATSTNALNIQSGLLNIDTTNSRVGIGNTAPAVKLHVGDATVTDATNLLRLQDTNSTCDFNANTGSPSCGSDITLKKDVSSLDTSDLLAKVSALRPVSWRWKTDDENAPLNYGFVAQEVEKQFPNLVTEDTWVDGTTRKFLNVGGLVPYLTGAVVQQQTQITGIQLKLDQQGQVATSEATTVQDTLAAQTAQLNDLQAKVAQLEGNVATLSASVSGQTRVLGTTTGTDPRVDAMAALTDLTNNIWTFLQDVIFKGNVSFEGPVAFVNNVVFKGRVTSEDKDHAGMILFNPGETEAEVKFTQAYDQRPIVNLTAEETDVHYLLHDVTTTGFKVTLTLPATQSATLNWQAASIKDAIVTKAQPLPLPSSLTASNSASLSPSATGSAVLGATSSNSGNSVGQFVTAGTAGQ